MQELLAGAGHSGPTGLNDMCGRFRVARSKEILEEAFDAEDGLSPVEWQPAL